jgi:hypothetical protein
VEPLDDLKEEDYRIYSSCCANGFVVCHCHCFHWSIYFLTDKGVVNMTIEERVELIEQRLEVLKQAVETLIHNMDSNDDSNRTRERLQIRWKEKED